MFATFHTARDTAGFRTACPPRSDLTAPTSCCCPRSTGPAPRLPPCFQALPIPRFSVLLFGNPTSSSRPRQHLPRPYRRIKGIRPP
eukprot:2616406-Rhodomonas_salina.1